MKQEKHLRRSLLSVVLTLAMIVGLFPGMSLTAYAATSHGITINTAQHGTVTASVNGSTVTSAEEGATVTLTANPDNGYRLKSISGTYKGNPQETKNLNSTKTINGTYFNLNATDAANAGWKLANNSKITITSKDTSVKIDKVDFNISQRGNSFNLNNVSCSAGTKSLNGNTLSVSSINGTTVTLSSSSNNAGYVRFNSVTIYGTGVVDMNLTISNTGDVNVRTFAMPAVVQGDVTITPVFEEIPKYSVNITPGSNMTKTAGSGAASQTGLSGAMTDVVYTADDGYYFPENYSVAAVNGISVTRNSYTQITVSGTPTADTEITLTAPTAKVNQTVTGPTAYENLIYDKTSHNLLASPAIVTSGNTTGEIQYKLGDTDNWVNNFYQLSRVTDAGTYTVYYKVPGNETYNEYLGSVQVTIKKASQAVTFPQAYENLVYNNSDQDLLKQKPVVSDGNTQSSIQYKVGADGSWADYLPTAKNAGTYTVYYKIPENNNYNEFLGNIEVEIAKADPTAPTGLTATYGQKLSDVALPTGWTWADSTQSVGSVVSPAATFKANFAGDDNYNAASDVDVTVTVSKADPTAPTGLTATYGQTLANVTLPTGWTWADSTQSVGNVVDPAETFKANFAGDDNHNAAFNVDVTVTVGKADQTAPTGLTATKASSNSAADGKISGVTSAMEYQIDGASAWTAVGENKTEITDLAAGTYKVRYAETANENASPAATVEVGVKVAPTVTAPTAKTLTYNGQAQELVIAGSTEDGTLYYAVTTENTAPTDDSLYTTSIPTATDAGTYYVWYKVVGDTNHNDIDAVCVEVDISTRNVTLTSVSDTKAYDGTALTNSDVTEGGEGFVTGEGATYTVTGSQTLVGESANVFTYVLNDGTEAGNYDITTVEGTLTVTKSDSSGEVTAVQGLVYDGIAKDLVTAGKTEGGSLMYALSKDGTWQEEIPQATDAGTYTVYYYIKGDENHNDDGNEKEPKGFVEVTIEKTAQDMPAETLVASDASDEKTSDGKISGLDKTKTYQYSSDGGKTWTDVKAGITDLSVKSGTYQVRYAEDKNHEAGKTVTITVSAKPEPTPEPTSVPTSEPTSVPTSEPTSVPTSEPTSVPTPVPTSVQTPEPASENPTEDTETEVAPEKVDIQLSVTQKGKKFTAKWERISSADGYNVYAMYCGTKVSKPVKVIKGNATTQTSITQIKGKKISDTRNFKVYVMPYKIVNGKVVTFGKSNVAHLVGVKNAKCSNVKALSLTKSTYTIKAGKTAKIKAKVTLVDKTKKHITTKHGSMFYYVSSDTGIATVTKTGKIKGIKKGTCTIYVYSINGLMKKAKITVN